MNKVSSMKAKVIGAMVFTLALVAGSHQAKAQCSSGTQSKSTSLYLIDPVTNLKTTTVVGTVSKKAVWTTDKSTGKCLVYTDYTFKASGLKDPAGTVFSASGGTGSSPTPIPLLSGGSISATVRTNYAYFTAASCVDTMQLYTGTPGVNLKKRYSSGCL